MSSFQSQFMEQLKVNSSPSLSSPISTAFGGKNCSSRWSDITDSSAPTTPRSETLKSNSTPSLSSSSAYAAAFSATSSSPWSDITDSASPTPRSDKSTSTSSACYPWSDVTEAVTLTSGKISPVLSECYPEELMVRNTFLELVELEDPEAVPRSQRRRTRSAEPPRSSRQQQQTSISNVGVGAVGNNVAYGKQQGAANASSAEPEVLPSHGSRYHSLGMCRPCGFFWKRAGCGNGQDCKFCHMCDPLEKRRRHKAKKTMLKAQAAGQAAAAATTP
eukprot:TRINITY_DN16831_c0_g1_i1.p1 TRINITY_DN16831_c0_g1~~TRINITY_DN16831_c0_g1_i1.p1  ORF type:complete len:275 (+),score=53.33 TRINITY_DN16831_c0_g1_i1:75-899(+)